jgi:hypothetical protein
VFYVDCSIYLPAAIAASAISVPAAARSALRLRTGFVDVQRSAVEIFTVQPVDSGIAFGIHAHFDEGESPGLSGVAIRHDIDALNGAIGIEHGPQRIFGGAETEITYKNILHFFSFLNLQEQLILHNQTAADRPSDADDAKIGGTSKTV